MTPALAAPPVPAGRDCHPDLELAADLFHAWLTHEVEVERQVARYRRERVSDAVARRWWRDERFMPADAVRIGNRSLLALVVRGGTEPGTGPVSLRGAFREALPRAAKIFRRLEDQIIAYWMRCHDAEVVALGRSRAWRVPLPILSPLRRATADADAIDRALDAEQRELA